MFKLNWLIALGAGYCPGCTVYMNKQIPLPHGMIMEYMYDTLFWSLPLWFIMVTSIHPFNLI